MCDDCTHAAKLADLIARFEAMAVAETDPLAARRLRHVLDELALAGDRGACGQCEGDVIWVDEPAIVRSTR
jgi:hypothetical protein